MQLVLPFKMQDTKSYFFLFIIPFQEDVMKLLGDFLF
jgi:hypothetical protein